MEINGDALRERALFYINYTKTEKMEEDGLSYTQNNFIEEVCGGSNKSDASAYRKFLSGSNRSARVMKSVESFLRTQDFWPEIKNMDLQYVGLANFFSGNEPLPDDVVKKYCRKFCYYQHSTNEPGKIATSTLSIKKPDLKMKTPTYLVVEEISSDRHFIETFRGILFRQGEIEVILMRLDESTHGKNVHGPKMLFSMKNGIIDGKTGEDGLVWLAGRLLKTSGHERRQHQSNWFAKQHDKKSGDDEMLTEDEVEDRSPKAHEVLFKTDYFKYGNGTGQG